MSKKNKNQKSQKKAQEEEEEEEEEEEQEQLDEACSGNKKKGKSRGNVQTKPYFHSKIFYPLYFTSK